MPPTGAKRSAAQSSCLIFKDADRAVADWRTGAANRREPTQKGYHTGPSAAGRESAAQQLCCIGNDAPKSRWVTQDRLRNDGLRKRDAVLKRVRFAVGACAGEDDVLRAGLRRRDRQRQSAFVEEGNGSCDAGVLVASNPCIAR